MQDDANAGRDIGRESQIEAAIARFEAAWLQGKRPSIDEFLLSAGLKTDQSDAVLWELVHAELEFRLKAGEQARVEEYLTRYPQLAADRHRLAELVRQEYDLARRLKPGVQLADYLTRFPDLADELQTQLRTPAPPRRRAALRLNCPHCQNPIEIVADETSEELVCPSCGSNFRLETEKTLTWSAERLPKLGKFELIHAVGKGAFGTVYRAKDTQLDRIVAVKLPRSGTLGSDADEDRFIRDARSTAQLRHPGIVPVYEVGRSETFPYIVMEFVEGTTLADVLTARRLSFREAAELLMRVSEALEHAHQQGVVHRDLKPSNIMLSPDGSPRLMDFGLAKRDAGEITMTMDGQILGTPAYMSPEQAAGEAHKADARSDIYSLGVILYQLLTGELPFRGNMRMLVQQVLHDEPRAPRKLNDRVPRDLETICLKAMAKEPGRRYATSQALADDLGRYLKGEPIFARPLGRLERGWRWAKRNPQGALALVSFAISLIVLAMVASTQLAIREADRIRARQEVERERAALAGAREQLVEINRERKRADQKAAEAIDLAQALQRQKETLRESLYASNMLQAQREWNAANVTRVNELLEQLEPSTGERDLRGWEWYYQRRICHEDLRTLVGHTAEVSSLAFSPSGHLLASASHDNTVKLWDTESGTQIRTFTGHSSYVRCVAFSPDGRWLASASNDRSVKLWDVESGEELRTFNGHANWVRSIDFSSDGRRLASAGNDGSVKLWDPESGSELRTFKGHSNIVLGVAFSPDGSRLASASWDQTVKLWDVAAGAEIRTFAGHTGHVFGVAFSPDGHRLASASEDKTVKLWDTETGVELRTFNGHSNTVRGVTFSPDGTRLASASEDKTVKLWDTENGIELRTFRGHTNWVPSVAFSPDGGRLASASKDGTVKLWGAAGDDGIRKLKGHTDWVHDLVFSPSGRLLASAGGDKTVKLWDVESGAELRTLNGHTDAVQAVAFNSVGDRLASASKDRTVKLWDASSGRELRTFEAHSSTVLGVAFSWGGSQLVSASYDGTFKVWDVASGAELRSFNGHTDWVRSVAFSRDRRLLASGGEDKSVKLWDPERGAELATLNGHTDWVLAVAFTPNGRRLASASSDQTIKLWENGVDVRSMESGPVSRVTFSPDGRRLASSNSEQNIRLWDAENGVEVFNLASSGPTGIGCLCWSQRWLATSAGESVVVWDSRELTPDEKMGQFLAGQIAESHASLDESLNVIRQHTNWNEGMIDAATAHIRAAKGH